MSIVVLLVVAVASSDGLDVGTVSFMADVVVDKDGGSFIDVDVFVVVVVVVVDSTAVVADNTAAAVVVVVVVVGGVVSVVIVVVILQTLSSPMTPY